MCDLVNVILEQRFYPFSIGSVVWIIEFGYSALFHLRKQFVALFYSLFRSLFFLFHYFPHAPMKTSAAGSGCPDIHHGQLLRGWAWQEQL